MTLTFDDLVLPLGEIIDFEASVRSKSREMKEDLKQSAWLSCIEFSCDHDFVGKPKIEWLRILRINNVIPAMSKYFWKNQSVVDCSRPKPGARHPKNVSEEDLGRDEQGSLIMYDEDQRRSLERKIFGEYFLVQEVESTLNPRETSVIHSRFLKHRKVRRKDIAVELKVSTERVRQIENQAVARLRSRFLPELDYLSAC